MSLPPGPGVIKANGNCKTDPKGYYPHQPTFEACVALIKKNNCTMANYISWGGFGIHKGVVSESMCAWYNSSECDFANLCVDCSKDTGPQCPTPKWTTYTNFTSIVVALWKPYIPPVKPGYPTTWHVVWTGGQSNAVGTNSQKSGSGYPTWPTTNRIQMFCVQNHSFPFAPARVPLCGEKNVGFSQTFANLLLATLPADHGVITVNNGVGGTGFWDNNWDVPNGTHGVGGLALNSVWTMKALAAAQPTGLPGNYIFHAMLWHQGEDDAGDNCKPYKYYNCKNQSINHFASSYCNYLQHDIGALIDYFRANFPGASAGTPFIDGGLLPYWVDQVGGKDAKPVVDAIYALNTSRPCTGTADSRIFSDFKPDGTTPNGEPNARTFYTGKVIHFNATQATMMGHQYWAAYQRAVGLTTVVPSARTQACGSSASFSDTVAQCTQ